MEESPDGICPWLANHDSDDKDSVLGPAPMILNENRANLEDGPPTATAAEFGDVEENCQELPTAVSAAKDLYQPLPLEARAPIDGTRVTFPANTMAVSRAKKPMTMVDLDSLRARNNRPSTNASQQQQTQQVAPALSLPMEDYHVVLKEKGSHLTVTTEFYRDHVQSIYGRVNCLSLSQLRDLKNMLDAFNRCKFGSSSSDGGSKTATTKSTSIPSVSFWIRKETAEKQAKQQAQLQHQSSTTTGKGKKRKRHKSLPSWSLHASEGELRYIMMQGKRVYFVQANDDCLRHDVRTSGDPLRAAQRQFKKLRKRFAGPSPSCIEKDASAAGSNNSNHLVHQNHPIGMDSNLSPTTTSLVVARRPEPTTYFDTNHQQKQNLFQLVGTDNLEERALRLCNQWIDDNNTTGMNRIIKKGLVSAFQEDIQHFQSKGLVAVNNGCNSSNNSSILVDVINGFGNRMIDYYDELTTKHSMEDGSESKGDDASERLAALGGGGCGTSSTQGDDFGSAFVDNISIAQLRVLVAEDNVMSQKMIARILTRIGIACAHLHVVQDGQKAVEAEAQQPFDVVLMDLDMPVMDGVEACKRIQKRCSGNHSGAAVVFLTSHASDDIRQECLKAGAVNFLSKPYNLKAITECLRGVAFSSTISC